MAQRGYPGIHAGMPTAQCLRSASVVNGAPKIKIKNRAAFCRSELAREKLEIASGCQIFRVIVNDLREQARSYREEARSQKIPGMDGPSRRPPESMSDYGHAEPRRGTEWWGKSPLVTLGWAGIPAFPK
ncbi:hypothetical protein [Pseudomonas mucidolens]